jgi:hypothetical protein
MNSSTKMKLRTRDRTDRERFNLLLSSVRGSELAGRLRECALCDIVLVSVGAAHEESEAWFEFVRCRHCRLFVCRECVVTWGDTCPVCYETRDLGRLGCSQFSHEDLLKLCGSARTPEKPRELLNPGDDIEVAEFAGSESEDDNENK